MVVKLDILKEELAPNYQFFTHQLPCDSLIPDTLVEIIFLSLLFVAIGGKVQ
jgi:hypothetical protein